MKTQKEKWVDFYKFPDTYEVSDMGKLRNKITKKISNPILSKEGYYSYSIYQNGKRYRFRANRVVYFSFNPQTPTYLDIHHLDHNKKNNKLSNLGAIDRRTHSSMHAKIRILAGTANPPPISKKGAENHNFNGFVLALCPKTFEVKHKMAGVYELESLGFNRGNVYSVIRGTRKSHKGFTFVKDFKYSQIEVGQYFSK
jgi:hypothetical protein